MTQQEKKEELIGLFLRGAITIGDLIDECFEYGQQHPHWIRVEDELPPKESEYEDNSIVVLATDGNGVYKGIYRSGEGWFTCDLWALDNVTHWIHITPPAKLSNSSRTGKNRKGGKEC